MYTCRLFDFNSYMYSTCACIKEEIHVHVHNAHCRLFNFHSYIYMYCTCTCMYTTHGFHPRSEGLANNIPALDTVAGVAALR